MDCYIKENSPIARIAARKLRADAAAIVVGRTIHLYNASRREFLSNPRWLRHELVHIRQFRRYGFLSFIARYLWESLLNGYTNNKYEAEARQGEEDETICNGFHIVE
ncbi:MAG: DUF4157 domain-containing protein [Williamsia sp.]|nr:DUF4157 domain-containing protein [Williamsia sp.]